jgi:hypothetical protein
MDCNIADRHIIARILEYLPCIVCPNHVLFQQIIHAEKFMERINSTDSMGQKTAVKKKGWWARYLERLSKAKPSKSPQTGTGCKQ